MSEPRSSPDTKNPARPPRTSSGGGSGADASTPSDTNKYRDRPSEDGKQGDAAEEPNSGFPHDD
jgi:hypothetical protein